MFLWLEGQKRIERLTRRNDGSMTIEFCILFPVLMIIFVSFLGCSMAFVRQSMILNHVNQVARAYSVGFFAEEAVAEQEIVQYSGYFVDEGRS